ncbi:MAG: PAS domain S-box protein [Gemmatimonadales bacterium]
MRARKSTPPTPQSPFPAADPARRDLERRVRDLTAVNTALTVELTHRDAREAAVRVELERRVAERSALLQAEKRVLELVSRGAELSAVLDQLCRTVEDLTDGMLCSIQLLDRDGIRLRHGAAPGLPAGYNRAVDGLAIGPRAGSCGTSAYRGERVIVSDLATDPLWADYRELALPHGLRACWSTPILDAVGAVLGTFALYYREPRRPTDAERRLIDRFVHIAGIAVARARAQEALTERERRFRAIFDAEPECVTIVTPDNELVAMNPAGLAMIEADRADDVLGLSVLRLVAPEYREAFAALTRRAARGEKPGVLEFEIVGLKGTRRWLETHAVPLQRGTGEAVEVLSITRDITDRKRAEWALRENEERYQLLSRATDDIIWDWNLVTGEAAWSEALERVYGHARPVSAPVDWWVDHIHPDDREAALAALRAVLDRGGEVYTCEYRFRRADGSYATVFDRGYVARDAHGAPVRMIGSMMDITERKGAEQAARRSREQLQALSHRLLEAREAERRHIAQGLHDELGQTLTAIKLNLQALRQTSPARAADPVAESLALIDQGILQVRTLSLDLRPSMLDDLGLVATLRWYLDRHGQRAGYAVALDACPIEPRLPPTVETACFRVTQEALTNVARHARARRVTVTVRARDAELELAVRDDGVGFDVRAARERAAAGASLGLLGMEELASLAGGRLTIDSTPGQGTAILARFPLREEG